MNKPGRIVLIVLVLMLSACTPPVQGPTPATSTAVPPSSVLAKTGKLHVSSPSSPGPENIPFWMALDTLREQGYEVETTQYARFDLQTAALVDGELDLSIAGHPNALAAVAKGAPIRAIAGRVANQYVIAAKAAIGSCADLQGKNVAYPATASVGGAMCDAYIERTCPGTQPQIIVISSSSNRLAALLAGEVDAAVLRAWDMPELERQAPGKLHVLSYFAEEFPLVDVDEYYVHTDFAAKHPGIVKDFVLALVQANRLVQDPRILGEEIARYLPDDATALEDADAFLVHKAWDVNGGLTIESIQATLTLLTDAGMLPSELRPEQVVDLSYLNAVLDEIGRR
jgi:NitT/TauT family transport system substrate-binding protein